MKTIITTIYLLLTASLYTADLLPCQENKSPFTATTKSSVEGNQERVLRQWRCHERLIALAHNPDCTPKALKNLDENMRLEELEEVIGLWELQNRCRKKNLLFDMQTLKDLKRQSQHLVTLKESDSHQLPSALALFEIALNKRKAVREATLEMQRQTIETNFPGTDRFNWPFVIPQSQRPECARQRGIR